jgi:NAD(P)-dependent dehydrogenase (short-subunit alcohol dehydrogenase family)
VTHDRNRNVAIITGAGSGVGRATALALAADGMMVALAGRRADALDSTAALIGRTGGTSTPIPTDVSDEASVNNLISQTVDAFGGVDVLICAAGVGLYGPVESYTLEDWQTTLSTNLTGVFLCARAALPSMRQRGGGTIIAVGSGAGKQGYANLAAYSASKFGLLGIMQSLAAEVGDAGIKVSTVLPGSILTDFAGGSAEEKRSSQCDKRYLEPDDVAHAITFLLSQPDRAWTQELNLWPF